MYWNKDTGFTTEEAGTPATFLTDEEYQDLLEGQSSGKYIVANADGRPTLVDKLPLTPEQEQELKNSAAREYLSQTDWYVIRQIDDGTPMPADVKAAREAARQSIVE
jgi:hypothetical protein